MNENDKVIMHSKLIHAPRDMNRREMRAFTMSLYALQKTEMGSIVEVDLDEMLEIRGMPKSTTKELLAAAFKALTKPCINLAQMNEAENWVPAYQSAEWTGDKVLIEFTPEIERLVGRSPEKN